MNQTRLGNELPAVRSAEHPTLAAARQRADVEELAFAGEIDPVSAHEVVEAGEAMLIDVRTAEERKFVGYVPGSIYIPWQTGPALIKNPRFLKELAAKAPRDAVVLFLCRSARRSADAAAAAAKAGYTNAFNILEGFEGDEATQRPGWRNRGLPWIKT